MGLREDFGGKIEEALDKIVDEKLGAVSLDLIKTKLHELLDAQIDKLGVDLLKNLGEKLKKDVIDLIDGQDDIK